MASPGTKPDPIHFGPFEFDRVNLELRKRGYVVKLQPQPLALLRLMVESAGRIVSRDEIRKQIWKDDTFVDFERGINFAISQIRAALGDDPEKPRFIETIPRRGYRFLYTAQDGSDSPNAVPPRSVRNRFRSLAVLPFTNGTGSPETEYLGEGISESIINLISQLPDIRVVPRSSAFRFRGTNFEWKRLARELNVDVVLTGSVMQRGDRLIVQTDLVDVKNHAQVWGSQLNRKFEDILELQEELSREICECLRPRLTCHENELLTKRPTENREAYLLYLKAMFYANKWTPLGIQQGFAYSRQAIEKDPLFAAAYAGLAYLYIQVSYFGGLSSFEAFPAARAAALKALQIDDNLATAHACLAYILLAYDWDWTGAERASRRAIELAPNIPGGHHVLSLWCLVNRRPDEAIYEAKKTLELDPLSVPYHHNLAFVYQTLRKYELGVEQLHKLLQIEPVFAPAHELLAFSYAQMGTYEQAFAELDELGPLVGTDLRSLCGRGLRGVVNAIAGRNVEARKVLVELRSFSEPPDYKTAYNCAAIHAALGEQAEAFKWLDRAREGRFSWLFLIKLRQEFEALHEDARFRELLRKMGLPE
ncbi:MAG TPA: winged helix-turn-helix domain-containing protein [Candidatus Acidoferrum sp.]